MIISVSDLKLHQLCPQKFHYQFAAQRGIKADEKQLVVGTLVHLALAAKLEGKNWEEEVQKYIDEHDLQEAHLYDFDILRPVLTIWEKPPAWEVIGVEMEMSTTFHPHTLVGRLDTLIKWNGKYWHLQHKTVAAPTNLTTFAEVQRTDWHESAYQYMAEEAGYMPFGGTILNTIKKLPAGVLSVDPNRAIQIDYLTRTPEIVKRAIHDIRRRILRIASEMTNSNYIEQNRSSCGGMFKNSLCSYKPICDGHTTIDNPQYVQLEPRYAGKDLGQNN